MSSITYNLITSVFILEINIEVDRLRPITYCNTENNDKVNLGIYFITLNLVK